MLAACFHTPSFVVLMLIFQATRLLCRHADDLILPMRFDAPRVLIRLFTHAMSIAARLPRRVPCHDTRVAR